MNYSKEEIQDIKDDGFLEGEKAFAEQIYRACSRQLNVTRTAEDYEIERLAAIRALRDVCEIHGDNDWQDDLYLPDIIEKHLGRALGYETA